MIHILVGNDTKNKNLHIHNSFKDYELIVLPTINVNGETLTNYASCISLFGQSPVVIIENIFKIETLVLGENLLSSLKDSVNNFVFLEDKILAVDEKKYKKFATILKFEEKVGKIATKVNIFSITDAYERRDKIGAWTEYLRAINSGTTPEAISGILFWKIKTMILNGTRAFSRESLIKQSSQIISLYHKAHKGEVDLTIGLEQFLLSNLVK